MAKWRTNKVGDVYKGETKEDGTTNPDYLKLRVDEKGVKLLTDALKRAAQNGKKGLILNLESKKKQLESIESAKASGKMTDDSYQKAHARISEIPDFVRFEVKLVEKLED